MIFSSALIENAVNEFARLPGVGKKTALRLVLHLLKQDTAQVELFSETIARMRRQIKFCKQCHNVSDDDTCSICASPARHNHTVCVVESIRDVIAIENTQQFNGVYHVLGGIISPIDGIGPDQLNIHTLVERVKAQNIEEVIMALSPTIEGDTTIYYLSKKLKESPVKITTIARGISFGGELEYADEMTLARSLTNRLPLENYLQQGK
ncbi:recombination protein RecR [Chitinophaga sp. SYP-B3965]|uniref:recombination mediator RecR n=1 Tax=Chitinophaga sp. SYP-B3965 TaxID=2663120 RepID=UPI001299A8C9|nr:recombination mediator RecR [Chitinophaga sp. SYP-B3965]MRG46369.1 recombination protein RecR [Chitinophaga sp. SYP-B3965]